MDEADNEKIVSAALMLGFKVTDSGAMTCSVEQLVQFAVLIAEATIEQMAKEKE